MGYGIDAVNAIAQGIPKITVAAIFQKDPWCLIADPNTAIKTLANLKGKPIYVSASANITYWPLLEAKNVGFRSSTQPTRLDLITKFAR